jgi:peptidoglycan-N-acetylglucosamine deacetylase
MLGAASTAVGAFAAFAAGYQTMAPRGQWYGRTFVGLARGSKQLALTYDDGPNDPYTFRLLEVLARHNVRATFFLIGRYVVQRPDIVRELTKAGHAIGNHSFSHPNLIFTSRERAKRELEKCGEVLQEAIGKPVSLFRPPFGGRRPGTLRLARELGLEPIMWSATGYDWRGKPAEYIESRIRRQLRGGDVILLHDGEHTAFGVDRSQTVTASESLIIWGKSQEYEFLTIPEMMRISVSEGHFRVVASPS